MDFCDLRKTQNLDITFRLPCIDRYKYLLSKFKSDLATLNTGMISQEDIYYKVDGSDTRLKLRTERGFKNSDVRSFLIRYMRPDTTDIEISHYKVYRVERPDTFKAMMVGALVEEVTVNKLRTTFHTNSVIINLDDVHRLGYFLKIETRLDNKKLSIAINTMKKFIDLFNTSDYERIDTGYRELMLATIEFSDDS